MRALILILGGLTALALVANANADAIPGKHFSMSIEGRYAKRWVTVYHEGSGWVCSTNDLPYFKPKGDPLADFKWSTLGTPDQNGQCRDTVVIEDTRGSPVKATRGCLTQPALKALVAKLDHRCRAE